MVESTEQSQSKADKIVFESPQEKKRCLEEVVCNKLREDAAKGTFLVFTNNHHAGSGWLTPDGRVATDHHVIDGAKEIFVISNEKNYRLGRSATIDQTTDTAVLGFADQAPPGTRPLTMATRDPFPGETMYSFTHKGNQSAEIHRSLQMHRGNLEYTKTGIEFYLDFNSKEDIDKQVEAEKTNSPPKWVAASTILNRTFDFMWIGAGHGSSGGPVFNSDGQVSSQIDFGIGRRNATTRISDIKQTLAAPSSGSAYYRNGLQAFVTDSSTGEKAVASAMFGIGARVGLSLAGQKTSTRGYLAAGAIIAANSISDYTNFEASGETRDRIKHGAALSSDLTMAAGLGLKLLSRKPAIALGLLAAGTVGRLASELFPNRFVYQIDPSQ